jgi:hypothetical protein
MDNTVPSPAPTEAPRPTRPDLDSWRGDIRERPPAWRRRPKSERVRAPEERPCGVHDRTHAAKGRPGSNWE